MLSGTLSARSECMEDQASKYELSKLQFSPVKLQEQQ